MRNISHSMQWSQLHPGVTPLQKVEHTPGCGNRHQLGPQEGNIQLPCLAMIFWCISEHLASPALVDLKVCESSFIISGIIHLDAMLWMQEMLRSFCRGEKFTWKGRVGASRCNRRDAGGGRNASEKPAFISCKPVLPFQPIFLICPHLMPHMLHLNLRQTKDRNTNSASMTLSCHLQLPQESQICRREWHRDTCSGRAD